MGMFDYKSYTAEQSAELLATAYRLATYANTSSFFGIPTTDVLQWLGDNVLNNGFYPSTIHVGLPDGWRDLTPSELHLPDSAVDAWGQYTMTSPILGDVATGPQAKIVGQYDASGHLTRVSLTFTGTNSLVDVADYLALNNGQLVPAMIPLLTAVRDFVVVHGLSAEDVIITGYSLGGGLTNLMAKYRDSLLDGFFKNANYVGVASPVIYDDPNVVLNYGHENDVVYRATGDETSFWGAVAAAKPGLVNNDKMFSTTADNIVLYDDMYASPLWPMLGFSLLNIPVSWYAHIDGAFCDAYKRITDNPFYEFMQRDSTTIVANLSAVARATTWVEDKATITSDHYGTAAFIIGSQYDDLLQGGSAGDYLYGGAGNDTIKTGLGADRIDGGAGVDQLRLSGHKFDWDVYRLSDGTLFFNAHDGSGMKQAENIEKIAFEDEWLSWTRPYDVSSAGLVDNRFLISWFNSNVAYQKATEGSDGADTLSGKVVFGKDGNDTLSALTGVNSLLHGGEGNDILKGSTGNDSLYGAEGRDVLHTSWGNDRLFGGLGDDVFAIHKGANQTHIMDFNRAVGERDVLAFDKTLFADTGALANCTWQWGEDVWIARSDCYVTVHNASVQAVLNNAVFVG